MPTVQAAATNAAENESGIVFDSLKPIEDRAGHEARAEPRRPDRRRRQRRSLSTDKTTLDNGKWGMKQSTPSSGLLCRVGAPTQVLPPVDCDPTDQMRADSRTAYHVNHMQSPFASAR